MAPILRGNHPGRPPQSSSIQKQFEMKAHSAGNTRVKLPTTMEQIQQKSQDDGQPNVPTSNRFAALSDDDDDEEDAMEVQVTNPTIIPKNPPIVVTSKNVATLNGLCSQIVASKKYSIKIIQIGTRIDVVDKAEHRLLEDALIVKGFEFFVYQSKETKLKKIALKGLYYMDDNEIKSLLNSAGVMPVDIKPLKLSHGNTLYILYFSYKTVNLKDLQKIEFLNSVRVRWEFFENRRYNILPQCRNCQMFGHSSVGCKRSSRCVFCAGFHKTNNCEFKKTREELATMRSDMVDRSQVRCVNCGEDHTANYKGCPERKKYEELQIRFSQEQNNKNKNSFFSNKNNKNNFPDPPRSSFTNHIPDQSFQTRPAKSYAQATSSSNTRDLFTAEEIGALWKEMIYGLQHCKTKMEQAIKLGEIVTKYIYTLSK